MAASAHASARYGSSGIVKTRKRGARRRASPRTLLKVALLLAGTLFLAWLCVRAAAVEALGRSSPAAAATVASDDPRLALAAASIEFRVRQGAISPAASKRAITALQSAPLAYDPFLFAGVQELVSGDKRAASAMILEARRRNPRSRMTRLIYLDEALQSGRPDDAAVEIAAISRLVPESFNLLLPELARYALDPKTAPALIKALRPDPKLRDSVLFQLASKGADPEAILRLARSGPSSPDTKERPDWQGKLLQVLVERGDVARARDLWFGFSGVDPAQLREPVYDGAFRGLPGPAPFNWKLSQSPAGVAERTRAPALQVEYYGRVDTELASQLLLLQPGRYLLSLTAAGNAPASEGGVSWELSCARGKTVIGAAAVNRISYKPKRVEAPFQVPANCPAQWLRLLGTSAEFPAAHSITISDVQIRRAAGR